MNSPIQQEKGTFQGAALQYCTLWQTRGEENWLLWGGAGWSAADLCPQFLSGLA